MTISKQYILEGKKPNGSWVRIWSYPSVTFAMECWERDTKSNRHVYVDFQLTLETITINKIRIHGTS